MAHGADAVDRNRPAERPLTQLSQADLERFRQGEEGIFRRLVDELSPRLLAFVRPFAADGDEAHDLVQDTWHRVYQKRNTYSGEGTLLGWLYAVCRNVCLGAHRRASARDRVLHRDDHPMGTPPLDAQTVVERLEIRRTIYTAVMELPRRERDVLVLRMLEQRSTRETAELLGCAEGTVKAALHHALEKLRSSMEAWIP